MHNRNVPEHSKNLQSARSQLLTHLPLPPSMLTMDTDLRPQSVLLSIERPGKGEMQSWIHVFRPRIVGSPYW